MDVFRNDGPLSDGALESLIHNGEALDDLTRLEAAEHSIQTCWRGRSS